MSPDPRIEAAARVRMAEEECSYPINVHPEKCVCEAHGTPFEGMALGIIYGHYAYMGGLCAFAVEQATATVAAIDKAATITSIEQLDALPGGSRIMLGCDLLMRLADTVDDSDWIDLSTASPVDNESVQLILDKAEPKVIVQYGPVQP